jgi:hypothetical protein
MVFRLWLRELSIEAEKADRAAAKPPGRESEQSMQGAKHAIVQGDR